MEIHGTTCKARVSMELMSYPLPPYTSMINAGCQMQWDNQWVQPQRMLSERLQSTAIHRRHRMAPAQKSQKHSAIFCDSLKIMNIPWYSCCRYLLVCRPKQDRNEVGMHVFNDGPLYRIQRVWDGAPSAQLPGVKSTPSLGSLGISWHWLWRICKILLTSSITFHTFPYIIMP
jgi:hypothetical protein